MLNEAWQTERFVTDVEDQDLARDAEVIVADGGSTDGSVERLKAAAELIPAFHSGYGVGMLLGLTRAARGNRTHAKHLPR